MQTFKQITNKLKQIIGSDKDKAVAVALGIKPTTFASMKRRQKIPYKAILAYCKTHRINVNTVLLDEPDKEEIAGTITVRYYPDITATA